LIPEARAEGGEGGDEVIQKATKQIFFWYQTQGPGRMSETPCAGMGVTAGRIRRYQCSTVLNFGSDLSMCVTFFSKIASSSGYLPQWITAKPKRGLHFECGCNYFEHLIISQPNSTSDSL